MLTAVQDGPITVFNNRVRDYKSRMKDQASKLRKRLVERILSDSMGKGAIIMTVTSSSRLGTSLRLDNIRCATCTYNCLYCEDGGPEIVSTARYACLSPYELFFVVQHKLNELKAEGIEVVSLSLHPKSEPTLDIALWREIGLLREFGIKIAVFSNASLLWNPLVQDSLHCADYLSLKIDTVYEETWRKINRPHRCLRFAQILESISEFSRTYTGILTTETMLVKGINDTPSELEAMGEYLRSLKRSRSYFMTPNRSSGAMRIEAPDAAFLAWAGEYCAAHIPCSEVVTGAAEAA